MKFCISGEVLCFVPIIAKHSYKSHQNNFDSSETIRGSYAE